MQRRKQKKAQRWLSLLSFLIVLFVPSLSWGAEKILILNSYHRGKVLSDNTIDAIVTELQQEHPGLTFLIEDMDTKRHSPEELGPALLASYAQKYKEVSLSAVITVDNNAFDFAVKNRKKLFPGIPLVFCGLNNFQTSMVQGVKDVTGVAEAIDIEATIEMALALHPQTTHLAVVSDVTPTGKELLAEFRSSANKVPRSIQIVELAELSAEDLNARLERLPRSSIVLRLSFFRDARGRSLRVDEQVELLVKSGLPVYDFWDEAIGNGYVGGYVVTGASQGRTVASMVKRILAGEPAEQIKIVDRSPNIPVFDMRQLLRADADLSRLPANAVLRFNEPPFWERHKALLIFFGFVFVLLLGSIVFLAAISVQRKRHAEALSRSEQKLRATLESIGEGVVTTNTQGEVEQINSVAERLIGRQREDAQGRPLDDVFELNDAQSGAPIQANSDSTVAHTASGLLKNRGGKEHPVALTASPISLPSGKRGGRVIVFRDMTQENELQQEIQQVRKLDALGQLAGGVAHDFNNMLAGIVGAAEVLDEEIEDSELSEYSQLILNSADRAAELTAQLLSFARKQPVTTQLLSVHKVIKETAAILGRTLDPRVEIELQLEARLDGVNGDNGLLHSALLNLGINASHAMPSGGQLLFATREVLLTPEQCEEHSLELAPGHYLEIEVSDQGTGIPPELLDRIFEPFFTTKEQGEGTGLGLAAVFGTVQQHGGAITVHSQVGEGTRFLLRLPLAEESAPRLEPAQRIDIKGKGRVLVVDDEDAVRSVAQKMLEALGYEVLAAKDGVEALATYEDDQTSIDVVLLDMIMPRMSGRDCFLALKQMNPQVRVIATSGFSSPGDLEAMARQGLSLRLTKPYRRNELGQIVQKALMS